MLNGIHEEEANAVVKSEATSTKSSEYEMCISGGGGFNVESSDKEKRQVDLPQSSVNSSGFVGVESQ